MWEVDPETKSKVLDPLPSSTHPHHHRKCCIDTALKPPSLNSDDSDEHPLLALQKLAPNAICVDCGAPSPQWASPKFGTFICLTCAGIHRGLGVHISFVRSVMMDSFKVNEVRRMEEGGNKAWRDFWDQHPEGGAGKKGEWERVGVEARYTTEVGEEWKERLGAKVEGREYVPVPREKKEKKPAAAAMQKSIPSKNSSAIGREPAVPRSSSPAVGGRKEKNEAFFSKLGDANASRSADLPPSQGGKYAGFGSGGESVELEGKAQSTAIPGVDEFQKDPMAALTKGFGWFTATVGKSAKSVNDGWIQPSVQKLAEADLASQARLTAAAVAQNVQKGTKGAAEQFNKFVEGASDGGASSSRGIEPEKKDFWDSFGASTPTVGNLSMNSASRKNNSSIGTSAMRKVGGGTGGTGEAKEGKEELADDGWDKF